mgnify:CR=1 FL=1
MDLGDPDEALLARVGEGDPAAVRALVARKLPRLLALAGRMLGDLAEAGLVQIHEARQAATPALLLRMIDAVRAL